MKVSVSDQGYGISPENQLRIFDKFYSTAPSRGGIGLGLAFCKLAVEAHGGKITVESETDKGSTFTVFLPAGSPEMVGRTSLCRPRRSFPESTAWADSHDLRASGNRAPSRTSLFRASLYKFRTRILYFL